MFIAHYVGQAIHGVFVVTAISGYDAIFIQCIMLMTYKFKTMVDLLHILKDCREKDQLQQQQVLVDLHKMHLNVLG